LRKIREIWQKHQQDPSQPSHCQDVEHLDLHSFHLNKARKSLKIKMIRIALPVLSKMNILQQHV